MSESYLDIIRIVEIRIFLLFFLAFLSNNIYSNSIITTALRALIVNCTDARKHEQNNQSSSPFTRDFKKNSDTVETNNFTIDRDLGLYESYFGKTFEDRVESLRSGETWVDGGAGEAIAQKNLLDLLSNNKVENPPQLIAVGVKKPKKAPQDSANFKYIEKDILEAELPQNVSLITDVVGAMSYSPRSYQLLQKYLNHLKLGGDLYVNLHSDQKGVFVNGKPLMKWLMELKHPGLKITPIVTKWGTTYQITKTLESVKLPEATLSGFQADLPPRISFKVIK